MEENDLQTSIEFKSQLDHLLNTSIKKGGKDLLELTELYDSKINDNFENFFHNNESQLFLEKEFSIKKPQARDKERSEINQLSLEIEGFPNGLNNLDIESLEQLLKSSYPNKKFNLNKSIEENSIHNSIALNHALLLLKSYDESKENDEAAVNETYLGEIEKILDGIHSPEKKSPCKMKKEQEILIELNNDNDIREEIDDISEFKNDENEGKIMMDFKMDKICDDFEEKARKTKNCKIF